MTVTVAAGDFIGTGTYANWLVVSRAFETTMPATAAEIRAGVTKIKAKTPGAEREANVPVALTYASTITPDLSAGRNFTLSASATFTLNPPTNCAVNDEFSIFITNTAGSVSVAVHAAYDALRAGALTGLSTANAGENYFEGKIAAVDGSGTATRIVFNAAKVLA